MRFPTFDEAEQLKATWSDKYVRVKPGVPEYVRFAGMIGRVVTVNFGGKAIVDFADGAWYDVPATDAYLELVSDEDAKGKYDGTVNSAQKIPRAAGVIAMLQIIFDRKGNSLSIWFDDPKKERICEESDNDLVLVKDRNGSLIGIEVLNFGCESESETTACHWDN